MQRRFREPIILTKSRLFYRSVQINVDSVVRSNIQANLQNADLNTFDAAQRKIQSLLESDAYLRFLQSELYKELLVTSSGEILKRKPAEKVAEKVDKVEKEDSGSSKSQDSDKKTSPESVL